jgi:hypothetical protein
MAPWMMPWFPKSRVPDAPTPTHDQESEGVEAVDPFRAMPLPPSPVEAPGAGRH